MTGRRKDNFADISYSSSRKWWRSSHTQPARPLCGPGCAAGHCPRWPLGEFSKWKNFIACKSEDRGCRIEPTTEMPRVVAVYKQAQSDLFLGSRCEDGHTPSHQRIFWRFAIAGAARSVARRYPQTAERMASGSALMCWWERASPRSEWPARVCRIFFSGSYESVRSEAQAKSAESRRMTSECSDSAPRFCPRSEQ